MLATEPERAPLKLLALLALSSRKKTAESKAPACSARSSPANVSRFTGPLNPDEPPNPPMSVYALQIIALCRLTSVTIDASLIGCPNSTSAWCVATGVGVGVCVGVAVGAGAEVSPGAEGLTVGNAPPHAVSASAISKA